MEIVPINNLNEIIEYLNGEGYIEKEKNKKIIMQDNVKYDFDFSEIKGQENVKRALEISAAGGHNCILIRKSWVRKNYDSKKNAEYFARY